MAQHDVLCLWSCGHPVSGPLVYRCGLQDSLYGVQDRWLLFSRQIEFGGHSLPWYGMMTLKEWLLTIIFGNSQDLMIGEYTKHSLETVLCRELILILGSLVICACVVLTSIKPALMMPDPARDEVVFSQKYFH